MTATYKLPEDVNEGSSPKWVVHPLVPLFAGVLTSHLIALIWLGLNGKFLGLRNQRKLWMMIAAGSVVIVALQASGIWLARAYDAPNLNALWGEVLYSSSALFAILVLVWGINIQQVPSTLYNRQKSPQLVWGVPLGLLAAIYITCWLLETFVFTEATILRRVLLG